MTTVMDRRLLRVFSEAAPGRGGCIIWTGATLKSGYGQVQIDGINHRTHKLVYQLLIGPVTEGLHLDHVCHNRDTACPGGVACMHRRCVNPHHLEPVTLAENARRSPLFRGAWTHCAAGHPFDEDNTYIRPGTGRRGCRQCRREASARSKRGETVPRQPKPEKPTVKAPHPQSLKTHCKHGHPFDEENTYVKPDGRRACRRCKTDRKAAAREQSTFTRGAGNEAASSRKAGGRP